jgi:hypothetical protein
MVNASSTQSERIILPRVIDLVNDILDLLQDASDDEEVWVLVIDIQNAFHLLPLMDSEKRFFCTEVDGQFQLYHAMLFGPKAAPSAWGRFGALLSRLTQTIVGSANARAQLYVDDPAIAVMGTVAHRSKTVYTILLWWSVLNIPLAWSKAQYSQSTTWIGAKLSIGKAEVVTTIMEQKLVKAAIQTRKIMSSQTASKKDLASYAGVLTHFAGIIPTLWPFVRPLWAVLYDTTPGNIPAHMFHTSRIFSTSCWFEAFLSDPRRLLARKYTIRAPNLSSDDWLRMAVDASPWGMGGVMWDKDWVPIEYFHTSITDADIDHLGVAIGDSAHMPVLEALAVLIALRLWAPQKEVAYAVRSDALGAIQAIANLRSKNPGVNRIAAEMALDIIDKQFAPLRLTHIPGISNIHPDYLSRLLQPGAKPSDCGELRNAKCVLPPQRNLTWWRTLNFEQQCRERGENLSNALILSRARFMCGVTSSKASGLRNAIV